MNSAWLFLFLVVVSGAVAHFIAVNRAADRDCGDFWAGTIDRLCLWLGVPLLLVIAIQRFSFVSNYLTLSVEKWLFISALGWLVVLGVGMLRPARSEEGRWVAGTLDFLPRRFWILALLIPFIPAIFFAAGHWPEDIYAANWALVVEFFIALTGIALSASPSVIAALSKRQMPEQSKPAPLEQWPEQMRSRGIDLEHIASWDVSVLPEPVDGAAADWQRLLANAGSPGVSGMLCDAVSKLLWMPQNSDRLAVALGPDNCGQEEVTALMATELYRRHGESTLVITSTPDPSLSRRLRNWLERLGGENPIQLADLSAETNDGRSGDLLVADAETLSDVVLARLRGELSQDATVAASPRGIAHVGLVVWWNAHEFSGVLAAHVWAVSRRLERLLKSRRGPAARTIVYARPPSGGEGLVGFLEHLLPYPRIPENTFTITPDYARKTHLYQLSSAAPSILSNATEASLFTEWPTLPPSDYTIPAELTQALAEAAPLAAARIIEPQAAEVLSIRQMTCQGGRATLSNLEQYVAVARSHNPYINFLVARLGNAAERSASVNLLGAAGHPELVERHLLVALREVPDTLTGLRSSFHWEEATLRNTLQRLSNLNRLSRAPVRFLDSDGRLQRDSRYSNQNPGQEAVRSFRTIGLAPVELRDPKVRDRVLMEVDPERLTIEAYPKRVIESQGRRYRVQNWSNDSPHRIDCLPEGGQIQTWRFSTPWVDSIKSIAQREIFQGVERYTAHVQYHEHVTDVLERDANGTYRTIGIDRVRTSFATEAVILEFATDFEPKDLLSAAAVLRHVLPVHVAVEESALDVVPVSLGDRQGLALVDLYPGGIGIADTIHKTVWLTATLFGQAGWWLSSIGNAGAKALSDSPLVRTMGIDQLSIKGVLRVFASVGWKAK